MTVDAPEVSVVIPLFNDADTIGVVLNALSQQSGAPPFEVIVVDDGSTDGGPEVVGTRARLVQQANAGPAAARNNGARAARGHLVLFLDSDCTPPDNWVAAMAAAISDTGFDGVMGTLRAANDGVVPRLVQLEIEDRYRGMAATQNGVDFIAAPSCGFVREVFLALGGFDERLRQAEDVEIAYRLTAQGHRIAFVGTAPVAHAHQTTWHEFIATKYRRAVGRLKVFDLYPEKRRKDSWTPLTLKVQFAAVAIAVPLFAIGLFGVPLALSPATGLVLAAIGFGWPLVISTARREASLIGLLPGIMVGAGFVVVRSLVILVAMMRMKLASAFKWAGVQQ